MVMNTKAVLFLVVALGMAAASSAAVYKVGDSSGWTIIGNVNYTDWATTKTFLVGDTIVFQYPKGIHNVMEVKKADYDTCTASSPIATYTSGDDKIKIRGPGHRFFICGVPGHCAAGQRVNIRVLKTRSSDAPSMAPAAPAPSAASPTVDGEPSNASTPAGTDSSSATAAPAPNASGAGIARIPAAIGMALTAAVSLAMLQ